MNAQIAEVTSKIHGCRWTENNWEGLDIIRRGQPKVRLAVADGDIGSADAQIDLYLFTGYEVASKISFSAGTPVGVMVATASAVVDVATGTYYSAGVGRRVTVVA